MAAKPTPLSAAEFHELVLAWAADHADPETGLTRVDCCGRRVSPTDLAVFRQEHVISAAQDESGELLAGFLMRYTLVCPACRAQSEASQPATAAEVQAKVAALTEPFSP